MSGPENRRGTGGRYPPGVSGNPGGRPRDTFGVRAAAQAMTPLALRALARAMRSGNLPAAVRAAGLVLERAWGPAAPAPIPGLPASIARAERPEGAYTLRLEVVGADGKPVASPGDGGEDGEADSDSLPPSPGALPEA